MKKIIYLFLLLGIIFPLSNGAQTVLSDKQPELKYNLFQNYPNPFNPATTVRFTIPEETKVSLKVFNALGVEVADLMDTVKPAGDYAVEFSGENLPSGIYFLQLKAGSYMSIKKMILLK
ncbi:MAG: T9SS type A sorting domain-containing protein [Syntrophomonadaceae bacterium]